MAKKQCARGGRTGNADKSGFGDQLSAAADNLHGETVGIDDNHVQLSPAFLKHDPTCCGTLRLKPHSGDISVSRNQVYLDEVS
ncbi:MAG: hypothetical protein GX621_15490 [Pirellulaceae bacterium]|nr:hypothetical protein [Pirellulaceae bacterium]